MSACSEHKGWKDRLTAHIRDNGGRITGPRLRIAEVFFAMEGHPGVEEVAKAVHRRWPGIGSATVYRTLHLLGEAGLIEARQFGEGFSRYEAAEARQHHDHLVCTSCGTILEFEDDDIEILQHKASQRHGFLMNSHRMEIYGLCAACQERGANGPTRPPPRPRKARSRAS